ncbi:hypothetical protein B484DRAFT_271988 [Ochromonadaceae sp. CCMP2298]|nr:hypothetical protein B484DRAFT_271988 [Ochromonadaceae sp. CCMP2298]
MSSRGKDSSSGRAQQETAAVDPVAKRIGRLRALVAGTLGLAAVIVGVGSYLGVDYVERSSAKDHFTSIVEAAVTKLDDNFKKIDTALILLSQAYASRYPALADWPTAVMPNFYSETPLVMEIAGADTIGFAVRVKPEDLVRYESFIFNYWDNDPNIPPDMAGYYSAAGDRGGETHFSLCLYSLLISLSLSLSLCLSALSSLGYE